jgi:hypothetical protein
MNLSVDVISDVICPWCFIGKRRLEEAMPAHGEPVKVQWHAFQLKPAMPKEGISRREYRIRKFGSWERSTQLNASVVAAGRNEGIHASNDAAVCRVHRSCSFVVARVNAGRRTLESPRCERQGKESLFSLLFHLIQQIAECIERVFPKLLRACDPVLGFLQRLHDQFEAVDLPFDETGNNP